MPHRNGKQESSLVALTRKHIMDSVVRLITSEGAPAITMDKVAVEAGLAKGTLYRYFKTKAVLMRATVDMCMEPMTDQLLEIIGGEGSPVGRLECMIHQHLSYFDQHRDFFRVLVYDRSLAQTKSARYKSDRFRRMVEMTASVIREGIECGQFRRLDPQKVAAMLIESNIALIGQRLASENPVPARQDSDVLVEVLLTGIRLRPDPVAAEVKSE